MTLDDIYEEMKLVDIEMRIPLDAEHLAQLLCLKTVLKDSIIHRLEQRVRELERKVA